MPWFCLEEGQSLSMPLSRNLYSIHKGLHELRLKDRTGAYRFFYFIKKAMEFILFMLLKRRPKSFRKKKLKWS
jgi:phage-related protein